MSTTELRDTPSPSWGSKIGVRIQRRRPLVKDKLCKHPLRLTAGACRTRMTRSFRASAVGQYRRCSRLRNRPEIEVRTRGYQPLVIKLRKRPHVSPEAWTRRQPSRGLSDLRPGSPAPTCGRASARVATAAYDMGNTLMRATALMRRGLTEVSDFHIFVTRPFHRFPLQMIARLSIRLFTTVRVHWRSKLEALSSSSERSGKQCTEMHSRLHKTHW